MDSQTWIAVQAAEAVILEAAMPQVAAQVMRVPEITEFHQKGQERSLPE